MVAGSIFANASSTGAKTVNSSPFSVSTRSTSGFSWPETAAVSVVSSGLLDAATATGSVRHADDRAGAVGHRLGVGGAAGADEVGGGVGLHGLLASASPPADMVGSSSSAELPVELQPARPSIATAVIANDGEGGAGAACWWIASCAPSMSAGPGAGRCEGFGAARRSDWNRDAERRNPATRACTAAGIRPIESGVGFESPSTRESRTP